MLCSTCGERPIANKAAQLCRVCYGKDQAPAAVGTTLRVSPCVGGCGKRVHNTEYLVLKGIPLGYGQNRVWCKACWRRERPVAVRKHWTDLGYCTTCQRPMGTRNSPPEYVKHSGHGICKGCWSTAHPKPRKGVPRGEKHHNARLQSADVYEIRRLYAEGEYAKNIAEMYGVHTGTIYSITERKTWAHLH